MYHGSSSLLALNQYLLERSSVQSWQACSASLHGQSPKRSPEMLARIVDDLGSTPTLSEICLAAMLLLSFVAFLRYDELARIRCCNIKLSKDCVSIHISSSKTDQFRQGSTVLVARSGNRTCPVAMLERYTTAAGISPTSSSHLFHVSPTQSRESACIRLVP